MNTRSISPFHQNFLASECFLAAWKASVERAHLYKNNRPDLESQSRNQFRQEVVRFVVAELLPHYFAGCLEEKHLENLLRLSEFGTQIGGALLGREGYKLGVTQKFLNLLLKYLWALGTSEWFLLGHRSLSSVVIVIFFTGLTLEIR